MDTEKGLMVQTAAVLNHSFVEGFLCKKDKINDKNERIFKALFRALANQNCLFIRICIELKDTIFICC